jgi:formamidopyrimidine-DNA glycosylase
MPEGLEVYVLAKVLKNIGIECSSYGKHLILKDPQTGQLQDMSFGLYGRIRVTHGPKISKTFIENKPSGSVTQIKSIDEVKTKLGTDWMTLTVEQAIVIIRSWTRRKKQIVSLLTDQSEIAGIGSYWVYRILRMAIIDPKQQANLLDFFNMVEPLARAVIKVRDTMIKIYLQSVPSNEIAFVNAWCENLYNLRDDPNPKREIP